MLALDYDDTYTLDPTFWDGVIAFARMNNHSVIVATMRLEGDEEVKAALADKVDRIVYCSGKQKRQVVAEAGYYPSVWIDDMPEWI